ncbi:MAG: hypothetical protein ABW318_14440 [Vicinamibacterales bacterium]
MEVEEIIQRLRSFDRAYPEDMFPALTKEELVTIAKVYPGFIDRASAAMGRHIGKQLNEIADELEKAIRAR